MSPDHPHWEAAAIVVMMPAVLRALWPATMATASVIVGLILWSLT